MTMVKQGVALAGGIWEGNLRRSSWFVEQKGADLPDGVSK